MRTNRVAVAIVSLLFAALVIFLLRACGADVSGDGEVTPKPTVTQQTAPKSIKMSTAQIAAAIKKRLDDVSSRPTKITCPKLVKQKIGTKFACDVFFTDEPGTSAVARASVEIDGPDGHFTWKSEPIARQ